jgi:hypothetical protein
MAFFPSVAKLFGFSSVADGSGEADVELSERDLPSLIVGGMPGLESSVRPSNV